jgi:hypothetical protein
LNAIEDLSPGIEMWFVGLGLSHVVLFITSTVALANARESSELVKIVQEIKI